MVIGRTAPTATPQAAAADTGLYIHIPFCHSKCGYCDFYSVAVKERATRPLVEGVIRELRSRVAGSAGRISTVFCGGGTPTILPVDELTWLLGSIAEVLSVSSIVEFTVEANPATVDETKARLLAGAGVTRVSMGAQSFHPAELATLERLHSPDDIPPSVETLRRAGIPQVNLDLIFGIPGQTMASWAESLRRAVELSPDHVSCYGLMYEPATRLTAMKNAGSLTPCDEDLEAEMYLYTVEALEAAGYRQYETSNFAKPGRECRHNLIYWRNQPYVGVGPSAAGCVDGRRYKNVADIGAYVRKMDEQGHAEAESERIEGETLMHEMILMQLRLVEGLDIGDFRARSGHDPVQLFAETLERLVDADMLTVTATRIALTPRGRLVSDYVMAELAGAIGQTSPSGTSLRAQRRGDPLEVLVPLGGITRS